MPSFDVVSELDMQEVRNAVDQAHRELSTRFDFKDTGSSVDLGKDDLTLKSSTEDRIKAVRQVLEEKLVKRKVSLKALDWGKVEEAGGNTVRQSVKLKAAVQVLEEKLVKRKVSLKTLEFGKVEEATKGRARQKAALQSGINQEKAKAIGKYVKELGLKGVQHQVQGDQLRIIGKKRDDLQAVIAALREAELELPLQFENFRD